VPSGFEERTAEKVATASTSVPPAVASEEIVVQSAIAARYRLMAPSGTRLPSRGLTRARHELDVGRVQPRGDRLRARCQAAGPPRVDWTQTYIPVAMTARSIQPNVPGRGIVASYSPRFWALVALIGVAAGLGGAGLLELLRVVQHVAWGYHAGDFLAGVQRSSSVRRVLVLAIGGLVAGAGTIALARRAGEREVTEEIWLGEGRIGLLRSAARAVHSIVIVALGASLGREAAPQQTGAAVASALGQWAGVPAWQRRLLVACGAGAGMAAVYNVPLGGALFALEVLLGTVTLPLVLPALATTSIAAAVAWLALPSHPTYQLASYAASARLIVWALVAGPIAGLAAVAYVKLIAHAHAARPRGPIAVAAPVAIFTALGAVAIAYPQLLGNGKNVVQLALVGQIGVGLLAVLMALKPLATAACLGSGASGGLFTPTLTFGVLLGGVLGAGWSQLWPGSPLGAYAVVGGAAVLAAAMQGPLAAVVLVVELTHQADSLMVPVLLAVLEATVVTRLLRADSIYSARMQPTAAAAGGGGAAQQQALPPARPDGYVAGERGRDEADGGPINPLTVPPTPADGS
jgi:chloride channel protein, CIC family